MLNDTEFNAIQKDCWNDKEFCLNFISEGKSSWREKEVITLIPKQHWNDENFRNKVFENNYGFMMLSDFLNKYNEFRDDINLASLTVKKDGYKLNEFSEKIRGNMQIVKEALMPHFFGTKWQESAFYEACNHSGEVFEYASEELKKDYNFCLDMAEIKIKEKEMRYQDMFTDRYCILKHVDPSLMGDKKFINELLNRTEDVKILKYCSEDIKNDKEYFMTKIKDVGWALQYASLELRSDSELQQAALLSKKSYDITQDEKQMNKINEYLEKEYPQTRGITK